MLDFISIFLGVVAWVIPFRAMLPKYVRGGWHYLIFSLAACAISMQLQIFEVMFTMSNDESVSQDVFDSLIFACGVMIFGTFLLNGMSIFVKRKDAQVRNQQNQQNKQNIHSMQSINNKKKKNKNKKR